MRRTLLGAMTLAALIALVTSSVGAVVTIPLGRAASFAVLAGSTVNNTGESSITGDVGVSPGTVALGFPPGTISGLLHTGNVASADAQVDGAIAYDEAAGRTPTVVLPTVELGGLRLTNGVYNGFLDITSGDLILDGQGNAEAVFIFQSGGFTVAPGRRVVLTNSARAGRIFWQLAGTATLGSGSIVKGNILADGNITIALGANLEGRAISLSSDVVIDSAVVRLPSGGAGAQPNGRIVIDSASAVALNRQTGLLEQTIRLRNRSGHAVAAALVALKNLPADVTVQNASGSTAKGHPYVQYNIPFPAGSSVDLVIEYFRSTRQLFASPTFATNAVASLVFSAPVGQQQAILRRTPVGTDRMLVEFAATKGQRYAVQYSDDRRIWKTAQPAMTAMADRAFWIDYGAPKTEGAPGSSRRYRVVRLF